MERRTVEWILWATAMVIFIVLALTHHIALLGVAITAVAVIWYGIVPGLGSGRQ